jgi:phosphoglycolate phosphatase
VFDLDGTLVDSAPGIASALQLVAGSSRTVDVTSVRALVSLGADALITQTLGLSEADVPKALVEFRAAYAVAPCQAGDAFPGVESALQWLREHGIAAGVCTNKPQRLAELVLDRLGLSSFVDIVVGSSPGIPPKPAAALVHSTLLGFETRVSPLYIGDSEVDAIACANAGVPFAFAAFGYGQVSGSTRCVFVLESFANLPVHVERFFADAIQQSGPVF